MTLFARLLKRLHRWDDGIGRDRDRCSRAMLVMGATPELVQWMDELDKELAQHRALVQRFSQDQRNPISPSPRQITGPRSIENVCSSSASRSPRSRS